VNEISNSLLGRFGAVLALLGVVAAPITSGDTAFRSARLIVADFLKLKQKPIINRLIISIPLFGIGFLLTQIDFSVVWRYFAWSNQTLATIVLWTITVYLVINRKNFWITLLPAVFMTSVISVYILLAPEGLNLPGEVSYPAGLFVTVVSVIVFILFYNRSRK
jgi:carbon starvation protein CstA